jgi:hypothetical protein
VFSVPSVAIHAKPAVKNKEKALLREIFHTWRFGASFISWGNSCQL